MLHAVKSTPQYFNDVYDNNKKFEVRENDRGYKVGDVLALNEYDTNVNCHTGWLMLFIIDYILDNPKFCKDGQVILGITPCDINVTSEPKRYVSENRNMAYKDLKKQTAVRHD